MSKEPSTQQSLQLDRIERTLHALASQVTTLIAAHEALKIRIDQFLGPADDFVATAHQLGEIAAKNLGTGTTQAETLASLLAAMHGLQRSTESVLALREGFDQDPTRELVKV